MAFERRDVHVRGVVWFGVGLGGLIGAALVVVYFAYWQFEGERARATRSDFALYETSMRKDPDLSLPPRPRIDGIVAVPSGQPAGRMLPGATGDVHHLQEKVLTTWRWTDDGRTAARIPIGEAMKRLLANPGGLLKSQPGAKPMREGAGDQPNASNSGRGRASGERE